MKSKGAVFAGSIVAAVTGASGLLLATGSPSFAAAGDTAYGVSYADPIGSSGWTTGSVTSGYGLFTASARTSGGKATVTSTIAFGSPVTVTTSCAAGKPHVVVAGGAAAGSYSAPKTVSLATFAGNPNLVGTVRLLDEASGVTTGAYVNFGPGIEGSWVRLGAVKCAAVPPPTSTSTSTAPTSTSTAPTSTTTAPTSTSTAPTSTTTAPTSTTTAPTSTTTAPTSTGTGTVTPTGTGTATPTGTGSPSPTSSTTGPPIVTDGPQGPADSSSPWLPIGGLGLAMLGAGALVVNTIRARQG